ncbi:DUF6221 family protein [Streptomyces sp. Ju416(a)]|uniref:DUF6221 family protein n=1 Tax=Streptomyces sp. Ju416(a) TaxID=3446591 RepID=UPI00403E2745
MTDALVAFLKARLDEDAAAIPTGLPDWHSPGSRVVLAEGFNEYDVIDESLKAMLERDESLMPFGCVAVTDYDADAKYIARHDPARTLREIEAKRRILRAHEKWCEGRCEAKYPDGGFDAAHYWSIKALAAVYDGHPDYLPEWRP